MDSAVWRATVDGAVLTEHTHTMTKLQITLHNIIHEVGNYINQNHSLIINTTPPEQNRRNLLLSA